jgi:hypothetical protein
MDLVMNNEMRKNLTSVMKLEPLKNKKWLFPETGKAGFHYDDISNAVTGLKKDIRKAYAGLHEEELMTMVEKWFPDVAERKQVSQMKQPEEKRKVIPVTERGQLKIVTYI